MEKKKLITTLIVGIIASLIAAFIIIVLRGCRHRYEVQITPVTTGTSVTIENAKLNATANRNGIVFIYAKGSVEGYDGELVVEVQPKDVPDWFKHDNVTPVNGKFVAKIQLGSTEWPIRGGEVYLLRISAGEDSATATVSVAKEDSADM